MANSKNKPTVKIVEEKEQNDKYRRLSAALRENLRKRKTQKSQKLNTKIET